ncbi:MAG: acetoacetate--CoA ligase [Frankiaceae bacterium]
MTDAELWQPSAERVAHARITAYQQWLQETRGLDLPTYGELWRWSVEDLEGFWGSVWEYFGVRAHTPYDAVLGRREMPGTQWFPGATLNYAEHALTRDDDETAVIFAREDGAKRQLTFTELRAAVGAAAAGLRRLEVRRGDRVAGVLPNCPEALIAFLAAASIGATWSSCSPDFGARAVAERFTQIEPTVLLAVDGYRYNGKGFDIRPTVETLRGQLPGLAATVLIPYLDEAASLDGVVHWADLVAEAAEPSYEPVPADHPLWILYSSGTTGLPKAIVQSHGGILLEHLKALALHMDLGPGDRFFWFTTTGWMMWNFLVSGLLVGSTIVLFDGSPAHPDLDALWALAEQERITCFGTSAPYLMSCRAAGLTPGTDHDLSALRTIGSTGAPLPPEGFRYVYDAVRADLHLASISGGSDVCTAFAGGAPTLPVYAGEIQCRMLGAKIEAYDVTGKPVLDEVGELVLTEPLPSMPVSFWNDPDGVRLRAAYFEDFPGVWRHGDWVRITPREGLVISGRSDSTLNRGGVRMGTAEFYSVVEDLPEIADSLVIDTGGGDEDGTLLLFVVLADGGSLDAELEKKLRTTIRSTLSPRHVPDRIFPVPAVPRTLNGKKCEVPVKRILIGVPVEQAVSLEALADPAALDPYLAMVTPTRYAAESG